MSRAPRLRLAVGIRLRLVLVTWREDLRVAATFRRWPLPDLVRRLETAPHRVLLPAIEPRRLGKLVHRILNVGPFHPRCLTMSLVLYRLLARQGTEARLVVGLPPQPTGHAAHAWVEVEGSEVGPPPGRSGHEELARFGGDGS
jgi:hypothetical protein